MKLIKYYRLTLPRVALIVSPIAIWLLLLGPYNHKHIENLIAKYGSLAGYAILIAPLPVCIGLKNWQDPQLKKIGDEIFGEVD
jgi:hypothetical protein